MRLCGGICILDPEKGFEPVAFLQFNKESQDQYPVEQVDKDTWKVVFDKIHSPGHEIGFSPDGKLPRDDEQPQGKQLLDLQL